MSMPSGAWGFTSPGLVEAQTVIIEGSKGGLFVYSPSAGLGNLVLSIAAMEGTDKYGNSYPAGQTIFDTTFQIENSGQTRFKLDQFGNLLVFNQFGALIYLISPSGDGWFLYADTGSATQGGLIAAATSTAGTDQFGNAYVEGVSSYNPAVPGAWSRIEAGGVQVTDANAAAPASMLVDTIDNSTLVEGTLNTLADSAATLVLYSKAQSGLTTPVIMAPLGSPLAGQDPATSLPDGWNSLGSPSATGYTSDHGRYRFTPTGEVEFDILLHGTAGNGTAGTYTYANTLPAAYRPAVTRAYPLGSTGSVFGGSVAVSTAGVVSIGVAAVARLGNVFTMPLD